MGPRVQTLVRALALSTTVAAVSVAAVDRASQSGGVNPQAVALPAVDRDDIGGTVISDQGREAGVWVVAETSDLDTRFIRIVVTDDQGRFLLPDLPRASYEVFVRGYGLLDSTRVTARPGERIQLKATAASSERAAAVVYPAAYWLTAIRVPPTGPIHPAELTRTMKACMECHQLGGPATRALPGTLGSIAKHLDAWDERMKLGPDQAAMATPYFRLRGQRTMFSEWTERLAQGIYPLTEPSRPTGLERNLVVTLWDWGEPTSVVTNVALAVSGTTRARGSSRVYGASRYHDALLWLDPSTHATGQISIPTAVAAAEGIASPSFGGQRIWQGAAEATSTAVDQRGRIWVTARTRQSNQQPAFCTDSANPFAKNFPLKSGDRQTAYFDPASRQLRPVDTCFTADTIGAGVDGRLYVGGPGVVGWIDTRPRDGREEASGADVQGWCPMVVDANRDQMASGWTDPAAPDDPARDRRIDFPCRRLSAAADGSVWCSAGGVAESRIVRLEIGANPPQTCRAEVYRPPPWRDATGARDLAVDDAGVVWVAMAATDHIASFDRRRCPTPVTVDPGGAQCPDGWKLYLPPGPPFSIASPTAGADVVLRGGQAARTTDLIEAIALDPTDVLGLNGGRRIAWALMANSDSAVALRPDTGEFVTLRVPYPLGFFGKSLMPRIDDVQRGWKGRGLWSNYASQTSWHIEGGPGTRGKVVKFQLRPDPLSR
jgi:hypothetical protein